MGHKRGLNTETSKHVRWSGRCDMYRYSESLVGPMRAFTCVKFGTEQLGVQSRVRYLELDEGERAGRMCSSGSLSFGVPCVRKVVAILERRGGEDICRRMSSS